MRRRSFLAGLAAVGTASVVDGCGAPPRRVRRIGYVSSNAATTAPHPQFVAKLTQLGYAPSRDIDLAFRGPAMDDQVLQDLAADLVDLPVEVLVAAGGQAQQAAIRVTTTVPIVLVVGPDPLQKGWVKSHARPGGNVTGVAVDFLLEGPKKLQLLKEAVPRIRRVAVLYRSDNTSIDSALTARDAAAALDLETVLFGAKNVQEMKAVLDAIEGGRFDGMTAPSMVSAVPNDYPLLPEFGARLRMPQIFGDIELVRAGGLMYYGASFDAMQREAAVLVDKILRGADVAELPVSLPSERNFVVNLATAERIGVTLPDGIIRQATAVIPRDT